ncbi:alpha/beta family hydrolase [Neptuniibacter sp. CAU 1671]|uniref:alpha/beta family hydrolase n=1 Tax=Neptuniibacter sp. CAU 1671 TaxID=3032593 RepID=UPI0023DA35CE|nr:alpha/beta family hydrolase [Neptuniibacter sp. CAU 1671]MDF2182897.1 alpha/beta hydrolase [Neptuniibacter sp. CAU 1671]
MQTVVQIEGQPNKGRVLLAHGAGAGSDSAFMQQLSSGLAALGLEVIRFEFPYMQRIRVEQKRRPPDRQPVLLDCFEQLIDTYYSPDIPLYISGKSMGGRMASMLMEHPKVTAGWVFGYPFHAPGKQQPRIEHLQALQKPLTIFQGERDPMGNRDEVQNYPLSDAVRIHWLKDGNHELKPRKSAGCTQEQHLASCFAVIGAQL